MNSYGTNNVAVALLFSRLDGVDDIDFTGCDEKLSFKPLSEMELDWEYPGHGNLSMGNTDLESVRYSIELYFIVFIFCLVIRVNLGIWKLKPKFNITYALIWSLLDLIRRKSFQEEFDKK